MFRSAICSACSGEPPGSSSIDADREPAPHRTEGAVHALGDVIDARPGAVGVEPARDDQELVAAVANDVIAGPE